MTVNIIMTLIGGLALFLYGMKLMSEGLEKAAGARLRAILEMMTKNRFVGMLVGVIFCAIVQSSSATTVMVVSFVNSGLMTLSQAAGVIMGANIGTTVTSQLVAFNLSELAPAFLMIGVISVMFIKKPIVKKIGEVVLGFGVLFMGLSLMSSSMSSLRDSTFIVDILGSLNNRALAIFAGFIITAIMQSSSVTVSIVLLMAQQGLLPLHMCFYIIMGCNIGSCMSALIASLGGKKMAKRAAMIHFLFNIFGTLFLVIILGFVGGWFETALMSMSGNNIGRAVANAHTLFKIAEVVMLFPFANLIVKLTYLVIPGEEQMDGGMEYELLYIGSKNVFSPATAVVEVTKELNHMGEMAIGNLDRAMKAFVSLDEDDIDKVYQVEKNINFLNHAISDYLVKINQTNLPVDDAMSIGGLFHVANDIERIGDHAENVADAAKQRIEQNVTISNVAFKELDEMMALVDKILSYALDSFSNNNPEHLKEVLDIEEKIDVMERTVQQNHVDRMTRGECTPASGMIFSDIVSGLERCGDHATNIAFAIMDEDAIK